MIRSSDQLARNLAWLDVPIPGDLWADPKADGLPRADAPTPS